MKRDSLLLPVMSAVLALASIPILKAIDPKIDWTAPLLWTIAMLFALLELRRGFRKRRAFWLLLFTAMVVHTVVIGLIWEKVPGVSSIPSLLLIIPCIAETYLWGFVVSGRGIGFLERRRS
jgi:hypothetical protein